MRSFRVVILFVFAGLNGFAQTVLDRPVTGIVDQPLSVLLERIEEQNPVKVFFMDEWLEPYQVSPEFNGYTLRNLLDELLQDSDVRYDLLFDYALVFHKDPALAIERESILNRAIVQRRAIEEKVVGNRSGYRPGKPVILTGTVRDQDDLTPLTGASVMLNDKSRTLTDEAGRFRIELLPGNYILTFHRDQYDDKLIDLFIYDNGGIDVTIQESPIILGEVVISDEVLLNKSIGKSDINLTEIKRAPVFLGEVDVIKHLQSQPGVTTVGEVASGFNVRGGSVDQNLVLYDDVPIFNTSHALGFFSAFQSEAISNASFYRGGVPSRFGGRVSSVLNITSRQGDLKKWTGGGGIGIISSYATIGGPLKKDTTSIQLSVRSTYSNWMLEAVKSDYQDLRHSFVNFYDGSLKLAHLFSDRTKLTVSGYRSSDRFRLSNDTTFQWINTAVSARLDHRLSERLFSTVTLAYGAYEFSIGEDQPGNAFDLEYSVTYPALKIDFQHEGPHNIEFGIHNTYYNFNPGVLRPTSEGSTVARRRMPTEKSIESALYLSDAFDISDKIQLEGGVRLSLFNRIGPATVYQYTSGQPREIYNIEDSVNYAAGEISKTYAAVEPRLSLRYAVNDQTSFKAGYHRMAQYMHLVTNTAAVMPTDIWQSSNSYFKPQIAHQISAGIFRNFREGMFESFVEAYYKRITNTLDFKDGADLIMNPYLETALVPTVGTSYGVEVSVSKVSGRLQGSANYTFSRSFRETTSAFESERINDGSRYPANQDQPHVANLSWRYGISRRIFFSGNFVFHTGRPVSLPSTVYYVDDVPIADFSERNHYRIPDYHRLDIAFIIEGNHKRKKVWSGNWVFSFYNAYARKNAYSVFFADDGNGILRPYRLSVIGTVIPSLTYSFKF